MRVFLFGLSVQTLTITIILTLTAIAVIPMLEKYFQQKYESSYTLDDYVILAKEIYINDAQTRNKARLAWQT